jgi:hypothetical protein
VITDDRAEPIEAIPVETATNPLTSALAWFAVAVVVLGVGYWVWTRWISPPVGDTISRYVSKDGGVIFEDPATAQFSVTMPSAYQTSTGSSQWGAVFTVSDHLGDYTFSVTKTPQPSTTLDSFETALNTLAGQLASDQHAEIVSQSKPLPLVDVGYKEVVYRRGSTYWRVQLRLLKDRLYTISAQLPNDDPKPYQRLTESFKILGPR